MSDYSQSYKTVSKAILQANEKLIREWANGSDSELSEACRMIIEASQS